MIGVEAFARDGAEGFPFADELEAFTRPDSRGPRPKPEARPTTGDLLERGILPGIAPAAELEGAAPAPGQSRRLGDLVAAGTRALLEGRFADAERVQAHVLALEPQVGSEPWVAIKMQRFLLHREQGRLAESLIAAEEHARVRSVGSSLWPAALALGHAELGMMRQARMRFERLADRDFAAIPVDRTWTTSIALLAETCALVGDDNRAAILYGLLKHRSNRSVADGAIAHGLGAISRHTALLAHELGRHDEAIELFQDAVVDNERSGARTWSAWSRYGWAEALLDRDEPGDREGATALLDAARRAAEAIGARRLFERARILQASALRGRTSVCESGASAVVLGRWRSAPMAPEAARSIWRKAGDFWTIGFDGRTIRLKDSNGLVYIRELLRHPEREFHVADLSAIAARGGLADETRARPLVERDVGPILDAEATGAYRQRLRDLQCELDDATAQADLGRAGRARYEMEIIQQELIAAYGLGGRARRASDPTERLRKAVSNQIRRAIAKIREPHPGLGRHLERAIHTGVLCSYKTDPPIAWLF